MNERPLLMSTWIFSVRVWKQWRFKIEGVRYGDHSIWMDWWQRAGVVTDWHFFGVNLIYGSSDRCGSQFYRLNHLWTQNFSGKFFGLDYLSYSQYAKGFRGLGWWLLLRCSGRLFLLFVLLVEYNSLIAVIMFEVACIKHIILPIAPPKAFWIATLDSYWNTWTIIAKELETSDQIAHVPLLKSRQYSIFLCRLYLEK